MESENDVYLFEETKELLFDENHTQICSITNTTLYNGFTCAETISCPSSILLLINTNNFTCATDLSDVVFSADNISELIWI